MAYVGFEAISSIKTSRFRCSSNINFDILWFPFAFRRRDFGVDSKEINSVLYNFINYCFKINRLQILWKVDIFKLSICRCKYILIKSAENMYFI
jgi:hypothetical protein